MNIGQERLGEPYDRFTDRARHVLTLAKAESRGFNHNYIGTEHLLLTLALENEGVAAKALANLGIDPRKIRNQIEFIVGRGERPLSAEEPKLDPRASRIMILADDEARRLGHRYIGTEHLLIALVREGEGIAAGVLENSGVSLERVRVEVMRVLRLSSIQKETISTPEIVGRLDTFFENPDIPDEVKTKMTKAIEILIKSAEESPEFF